jgi:hypothetical protein
MIRRFKNIISLLLLLVFLLPTIVKIEHHHDNFQCKSLNEKHFHDFHPNCAICNFEFSIFILSYENIDFQKDKPVDNYSKKYNSRFSFNLYLSQFSLRGPPVIQI